MASAVCASRAAVLSGILIVTSSSQQMASCRVIAAVTLRQQCGRSFFGNFTWVCNRTKRNNTLHSGSLSTSEANAYVC